MKMNKASKLREIIDNRIVIAVFLIALIVLSSVPAFRSAVYDGHDLKFHFGRIQAIAEDLQAGQFPVRYEANAWYGHGYVNSLFYGNVFLYIPALLYMAGFPVFRVYNIYLILVNVATVLVGYYSFKGLFKDNVLALLSTGIYTLYGYRLTNLYVRTALGEYTAMIFIPLCIYGMYRIYSTAKSAFKDCLPLIIAATGLIESHVLTTEFVAMFCVLFAVVNYKDTVRVIKQLALSLALILGINAFFIVPFVMSYTGMQLNINSTLFTESIRGEGLYISQLFHPFTLGYGYNTTWSTEHEECYRVGLLILFCFVAMIVYVVVAIAKKQKINKYFIQLTVFGLIAGWMSTVYFPWDAMLKLGSLGRIMSSVQYPWRFLSIMAVCFIIAGVYGLSQITKADHIRLATLAIVVAVAVMTTGVFDYTLSFGKNVTNQTAITEWADKLYLPAGTDTDLLNDTAIYMENDAKVLPVLAYDNVRVFDKNGTEVVTGVSKNNCLTVNQGVDTANLTVKYVEPFIWRLAELISLAFIIGIAIYSMKNRG